jgi:hypothetical protein
VNREVDEVVAERREAEGAVLEPEQEHGRHRPEREIGPRDSCRGREEGDVVLGEEGVDRRPVHREGDGQHEHEDDVAIALRRRGRRGRVDEGGRGCARGSAGHGRSVCHGLAAGVKTRGRRRRRAIFSETLWPSGA